MKCMVMFQYTVFDMHFDIAKFNGFLSDLKKKITIECFSFFLTKLQVCLFSNEERFKRNFTYGFSGY